MDIFEDYESFDAEEAAYLLKRGLALLENDDRVRPIGQKRKNEDDLPYYERSDRLEVAAEYIKKAAELEPDNPQAWLSWGRAIEAGLISLPDLYFDWLNGRFCLFFLSLKPKPLRIDSNMVEFFSETLRLAEEKYQKAAELDSQNIEVWMAWSKNTLKRLMIVTDQKEAFALLEAYRMKLAKIRALDADNPKVRQETALDLASFLPYVNDESQWRQALREVEYLLDSFINSPGPRKPSTSTGTENSGETSDSSINTIINSLRSTAGRISCHEWAKKAAVWNLNRKYSAKMANPGRAKIDCLTMGREYIEAAHGIEDEDSWMKIISLGEAAFEQAEKFESTGNSFAKVEAFLDLAEDELNPVRRNKLVDKVRAWLADGSTRGLELTEQIETKDSLSAFKKTPLDFDLRIDLLAGNDDEIKERALKNLVKSIAARYKEKVERTDKSQNYSLYRDWALEIIRLAIGRDNDDQTAWLIQEARAVERLRDESDLNNPRRYGPWKIIGSDSFQDTLEAAVRRERHPEQIRKGLEIALDDLQALAVQASNMNCRDRFYYYEQLIVVYLKLARLPGTAAGKKMALWEKALSVMENISDLCDVDDSKPFFILSPDHDGRFTFAQALIQDFIEDKPYHRYGDRHTYFSTAGLLYKKHFKGLLNLDKTCQYSYSGTGAGKESFQSQLTLIIAGQVNAIRRHLLRLKINDAWSKIWLADIYRHTALSGMLLPHYRDLYFQRAETLLRESIEMNSSIRTDEKEEKGRINDLAFGLSELGLLLSEMTLAAEDWADGKDPRLDEARRLWMQAEEISPGSTRYAEARWAAWNGDIEKAKRLIRHGSCYSCRPVFPEFEQAVLDPAFLDIGPQPWFKKAWYGLDKFGSVG